MDTPHPNVQSNGDRLASEELAKDNAPVFLARHIAAALGCTKRAVLSALASASTSGEKEVAGGKAKTWAFCALPVLLQAKLENAAIRQNFRNAEALLRHWAEHVEEAPAPTVDVGFAPRDLNADLAVTLSDYLQNRKDLSRGDREWVWAESCRHFTVLIAATPEAQQHSLKPSLIRFLLKEVPGLVRPDAKHPARALQRDFERKLAAFIKGGRSALRDNRETRSGNYKPILCPQCWAKFMPLAVKFGGSESRAWRELKQSGEMCPDCQGKHSSDLRRSKSYVPGSVRGAATPLVDAALPWVKSAAAGRMAGPYIPRDWSDTAPGDYFVGDDVTWNHEVYDYDEHGQVIIFRPECIYFADERTAYPLEFLLIAGHYNGRHIRRCMLSTHDKAGGIPHRGWRFENGVWRSRTVRDEADSNWVDFRETEDGFKTLGSLFVIRHALARNPRSKTVEGDFRILQERMRLERGFVGFNEREEKSDSQKDLRRRVLRGAEDPRSAGLFSFEQWGKRLSAIFEEFANEPQNGARNPSRSPIEGWRDGLSRKPLRKLPDEARWIMATCRQLKTITPRGIVLDFGKNEKWTYADEALARIGIGRQVWVYYHLDCPGLVTVCDFKRTEYISVKGIRLPANTATPEQLGAAQRQIAEFNRIPKTIAGSIKHPVIATITRDNEFSQAEMGLGRHIEAAKTQTARETQRVADLRSRRRIEGERLMREALMESPKQD